MVLTELPKELPKDPKGWRREMVMHLNFGHGKNGGGAATFKIKDASGAETPIGYQYDTRKGGQNGFSLPGIEPLMSWNELREMWPVWLEKQKPTSEAK